MPENYYNPLSDMGRIKESLISLFSHTEDLTRLIAHCFDTPYMEGIAADCGSAIFVETYLTKKTSQRIKEVGIDIWVLCQKDSIELSETDKAYYQSKGIYGNRIDSSIQVIHSSLSAPRQSMLPWKNTLRKNTPLENTPLAACPFLRKKIRSRPVAPEPDFTGNACPIPTSPSISENSSVWSYVLQAQT